MRQRSFDIALQKGKIGEDIIRKILEDRGWIVYFPFTKDKAHYFDMLATKDKEKVIALDIKTKARFNKWAAQGIDTRHYEQYKKFASESNIPFYLIFVDDKNGDIHLAELLKLKDGFHPGDNDKIIAWPLSQMKYVSNIGLDKVVELSKYDQRNYEFNPI